MALTKEEINRKLLHVLSGCAIPAGILYLPAVPGFSPHAPLAILVILLAVSLGTEYVRFYLPAVQKLFVAAFGSMLRAEEEKKITGSTYILLSSVLCVLLFAGQPYISFMVLNMFILGDAIAAIVGLSIGRIRIGKKSLEGSCACCILCTLLLTIVYPKVPMLLDPVNGAVPLPLIVIASLCITVLELFPLRIPGRFVLNDNLTVPVITGLVMKYGYPFFS
jgi:dolichol kinase